MDYDLWKSTDPWWEEEELCEECGNELDDCICQEVLR